MPNSNCLEGFKCPKCKSEGPFNIEMKSVITLHDNGTDEHSDTEWGQNSYCDCAECCHSGIVADFREGEKKPQITRQRFDAYEIKQVVEYTSGRGGKFCEPLESGTIEQARKDPSYLADFWTLYGHLKGEGVQCIGDFKGRAEAVDIYCLITGDYILENLNG